VPVAVKLGTHKGESADWAGQWLGREKMGPAVTGGKNPQKVWPGKKKNWRPEDVPGIPRNHSKEKKRGDGRITKTAGPKKKKRGE